MIDDPSRPDKLPDDIVTVPHLRLRTPTPGLLELPWERSLARWPAESIGLRELPVGPSRHLVRFLDRDGKTYALKEMPLDIARREYEVLRRLEQMELPAVLAVGLAGAPQLDTGILVTEYLAHSLQYRRLLMRFPLAPGPYRDRLLDAMASLLVDLHRSGVFWGDCSLANTLFRRDGNKIQANLVDAETSEIHPSLSDGQRKYDLEVLVENVAFGLADLAALQGRSDMMDDAIRAAEAVRDRYEVLWNELHAEQELRADDRFAVAARVRRLNKLGFTVDEIQLLPASRDGRMRLRVAVTNRRFHVQELARLTGLFALEDQARLLLNDLREYRAWLEFYERRKLSLTEGADRWLREVLEPRLAELAPAIGPHRDPLQAYCDVLELKWLMSEEAGHDIGLAVAIETYIGLGAPAPEGAGPAPELDIDWSGGLDSAGVDSVDLESDSSVA